MQALSTLVAWAKSQESKPTELQLAVQTVLQAVTAIHDSVVYQMNTINALCEKYGLDEIMKELPEEQQVLFKETMGVIQTAWAEVGSDPVPELPVIALKDVIAPIEEKPIEAPIDNPIEEVPMVP